MGWRKKSKKKQQGLLIVLACCLQTNIYQVCVTLSYRFCTQCTFSTRQVLWPLRAPTNECRDKRSHRTKKLKFRGSQPRRKIGELEVVKRLDSAFSRWCVPCTAQSKNRCKGIAETSAKCSVLSPIRPVSTPTRVHKIYCSTPPPPQHLLRFLV